MSRCSTVSQYRKDVTNGAAEVRELCFDISRLRLNPKLYGVSDFVYSLVNHSETERLLLYERTIRYAEFPLLDSKVDDKEAFADNTYLAVQHTEVFDILDWLRDKKKVQSIIELTVPDRLVNPHDEEGIAEYVEKFDVKHLNWKCLDLSLSVFTLAIRKKIVELHLYSSGKRAVIDHWLGSDGILTLPQASHNSSMFLKLC